MAALVAALDLAACSPHLLDPFGPNLPGCGAGVWTEECRLMLEQACEQAPGGAACQELEKHLPVYAGGPEPVDDTLEVAENPECSQTGLTAEECALAGEHVFDWTLNDSCDGDTPSTQTGQQSIFIDLAAGSVGFDTGRCTDWRKAGVNTYTCASLFTDEEGISWDRQGTMSLSTQGFEQDWTTVITAYDASVLHTCTGHYVFSLAN